MGTRLFLLVVSVATVSGFLSTSLASSDTTMEKRPGGCPVLIEDWNGMEIHCGEAEHPVLCHFRIGPEGWQKEQDQSDGSFPKFSLDIKLLRGDFLQAARYAGFVFKPPAKTSYQTWPKPEPTPVPPPQNHPNPEAARYWCTPSRMHESCGAEYIAGETWSGYVIGASFGFHTSSGYGGTVEACRLIAQGPENLFLVAEGIGGCRGLQDALDRIFEEYLGRSWE